MEVNDKGQGTNDKRQMTRDKGQMNFESRNLNQELKGQHALACLQLLAPHANGGTNKRCRIWRRDMDRGNGEGIWRKEGDIGKV
jgi:hypothetical protein